MRYHLNDRNPLHTHTHIHIHTQLLMQTHTHTYFFHGSHKYTVPHICAHTNRPHTHTSCPPLPRPPPPRSPPPTSVPTLTPFRHHLTRGFILFIIAEEASTNDVVGNSPTSTIYFGLTATWTLGENTYTTSDFL